MTPLPIPLTCPLSVYNISISFKHGCSYPYPPLPSPSPLVLTKRHREGGVQWERIGEGKGMKRRRRGWYIYQFPPLPFLGCDWEASTVRRTEERWGVGDGEGKREGRDAGGGEKEKGEVKGGRMRGWEPIPLSIPSPYELIVTPPSLYPSATPSHSPCTMFWSRNW